MIQAKIFKNKVIIEGHADYAEHGKDIVCSSLSFLAQTIANELNGMPRTYSKFSRGYGEVYFGFMGADMNYNAFDAQHKQTLYDLLVNAIESLSENYPNNVQFEHMEEH